MEFTFEAPAWRWSGEKATRYFVTVPADVSAALRAFAVDAARGFGSVRVGARIGGTTWSTSVFPDKASGCYFLPVKATVRRAEALATGVPLAVTLTLDP